MFTKEFEDRIKAKLDNLDSAEYLGKGIARKVYTLDEDYVIKVQKNQRVEERYQERIIERIKKKNVEYSDYRSFKDFINTFDLEENDEAIEQFLDSYASTQSINEYINWQSIKNNEVVRKYIAEVYGIIRYNNLIVVVQEKCHMFKDTFSTLDDQALKFFNVRGRRDLEKLTEEVMSILIDNGINGFHDEHLGNFVYDNDGNIKICDLGYGDFSENYINSDENSNESS